MNAVSIHAPAAPRVAASTPRHVVGEWEDVCFLILRGEIRSQALQDSLRSRDRIAERYGQACSFTLAHWGVPLPHASVRMQAARMMRQHAASQRISVAVVEGSGFWASTARGVLMAIQGLSLNAYPQHVRPTVPEACQLVAERTARGPQWAAQMADVVDWLRQS